MTGVPLWPPVAAEGAASTDHIFIALLIVSGAIILLVSGLLLTFSIRYRHGSSAPRGQLPDLVSREVEIFWTSATFFLALFLFWFAGASSLASRQPPADALEIHITGKQWMWKAQHPSGAREINALHVPTGQAVRLVMTSEDVIHSFYVPAFRVKQDVVPGRLTTTWFRATVPGTYHLLCTEFCGTDHSRMTGDVVVMTPEEYARWSRAQPQGDDLGREGEGLFSALGCAGCHVLPANSPAIQRSTIRAPSLAGIFGTEVPTADGRRVLADEAYLRDSILQPRKDIVAGFAPVMPAYQGVITEDQLVKLVAYIRRLGTNSAAAAP